MKKKLIVLLLFTSILLFQTTSQAEEKIGIGDVIPEENVATSISKEIFFVNELSYMLTKMHFILAGKIEPEIKGQSESLATIKKLEDLTKTDVIGLLDISTNKQAALHRYIVDCEQTLQRGETISVSIQQEIKILKSDMEDCLTDKEISNQEYFDAIDIYDQKTMELAITESIVYENCATENRIQYNAKTAVVRKLVFYLGLLQKKYDVLFNKQEILAKNFEIFRDNILPELNEIDTLLKQYTF